jgi:hypothetical protein
MFSFEKWELVEKNNYFFLTMSSIAKDALSTFTVSVINGFGMLLINNYNFNRHFSFYDFLLDLFYKKSSLKLEFSKHSFTNYLGKVSVDSIFSDHCKSIWNLCINSIDNNNGIYEISEMCTGYMGDENHVRHSSNAFAVTQPSKFLIHKELRIYAKIENSTEEYVASDMIGVRQNKPKREDKLIITLFSYHSELKDIKIFLDQVTKTYLRQIQLERQTKRYVWTLYKLIEDDVPSHKSWTENEFKSFKSFDNIFFDGKQNIISKIDFFLNNKEWYNKMGVPYTLGICLHGSPGTGKTSFIKALSKHTKRHIVIISLKLIKTKEQLLNYFFEAQYNSNNTKGSIQFKDKIIVFEDLDCSSGIVIQRDTEDHKIAELSNAITETTQSLNKQLSSINNNSLTIVGPSAVKQPTLTLDDVLQVLDGIYETTDRILVMTTNYYSKLDSALVRPGRIDITLNLENVSHEVIRDFFNHLFQEDIDEEILKRVSPFFYSPAEIMNIYLSCNKSKELFISRLLENKH